MLPAHAGGHLPPHLGRVVAVVLLQVSELILRPPQNAFTSLTAQGNAVQAPLPAQAGLALPSTVSLCVLCCGWMNSKLGCAQYMGGEHTLQHLGLWHCLARRTSAHSPKHAQPGM